MKIQLCKYKCRSCGVIFTEESYNYNSGFDPKIIEISGFKGTLHTLHECENITSYYGIADIVGFQANG